MIFTLTAQHSIDAREQLQLSQTKVASATGIPRMYISQFETSKRLLKDSENDTLFLFYESEGWQVSTDTNDDNHETTEKPNKQHQPQTPLRIRDGFVITPALDNETLETLMDEYYAIEQQLETLENMPIERSFFGDIDEQETLNKAFPLLLKYYRLYQIEQVMHGHKDDDGIDNPSVQDEIKTLGDYLIYKLIK